MCTLPHRNYFIGRNVSFLIVQVTNINPEAGAEHFIAVPTYKSNYAAPTK